MAKIYFGVFCDWHMMIMYIGDRYKPYLEFIKEDENSKSVIMLLYML